MAKLPCSAPTANDNAEIANRLIRRSLAPVLRFYFFFFFAFCAAAAVDYRGHVQFGGLPVPGATVTATQGDKKFTAVTDQQGIWSFPDLPDGQWIIDVEMLCFESIKQDVSIAPGASGPDFEMKLLSLDRIKAAAGPVAPAVRAPEARLSVNSAPRQQPASPNAPKPASGFQRTDVNASSNAAASSPATDTFANQSANDLSFKASDGFLINGTTNNGASSPFALAQAFGNNRRGPGSLYNGSLGVIFDNSALDARPFSLTGQDTPKPAYNRFQGLATFGGPLRIPHLLRNGPVLFVSYQWNHNRNATTLTGLVPTQAQRTGDLSGLPTFVDPTTGLPFIGNIISANRLNPQATALLNLYPLPNFNAARYNYQVAADDLTNQDNLQTRINKNLNSRNQVYGDFAWQGVSADTMNLFGFLDKTSNTGINTSANWQYRFSSRMFAHFKYQYSYFSTHATPYFSNRQNVSGQAGITGNNQDPINWGPPALVFSSGISPLSDLLPAYNRNQTAGLSYDTLWVRARHNINFGADFRRQQFNYFAQQDPRGAFTFTGAATAATANNLPMTGTGADFADFLLGIPDTSSIAYGNADKYFRASLWDAFIQDDWRIGPQLTFTPGVRWEYSAPITELYGRLVNLDIARGFTTEAPVVASNPVGPTTGTKYPSSLMQPDKSGFEPRIGLAWRPIAGSSVVVRAGYGIYYNTSVYQSIATQMAQQPPLSRSLAVQNSPLDPLTLASGFNASPSITPNTFAVDPNFRVGFAHNWQVSIQKDLPGSVVMTATYLGSKGTRGMQEFLPNTYPIGAVNPCPACPSGYIYMASNGNSTREAAQVQLRRRLRNGFTATLQYTFAKAIDDSALGGRNQGGALIAQNWLNLGAERALSNFDQRHLLNAQIQYTSGMGMGGGALLSGLRGGLLKEWTFATQITAGSGSPLTPNYLAAVNGTGVTGPIRPDYTGASLYSAPSGLYLNPAAYAAPPSGQWGNAGRNSITGPGQFAINASLGRTFRLRDRLNLDLRFDSTNALNHVVFTSWNTTVTSAQFGLPVAANAMRSIQTTVRLRF